MAIQNANSQDQIRTHLKQRTNDLMGKTSTVGKQCHRKQECRGRTRDEAIGISKPDAIQPAKQKEGDKPKFNPMLMCLICGYTGQSARECRKRIPKETSTPYGQVQYEGSDDQENKERRRDMKRSQRPLNQLDAQGDNSDLSSDGEQDFQ